MKLEDIDIRGRIIETERLILRPFKESDLNDLYAYARVEGVGEAAGWIHHRNIDESRQILDRFIEEHRTFAVTDRKDGRVIGSVGIEKSGEVFDGAYGGKNINELGYVLSKDFWGKGLMTEAVKAVIRYMFGVLKVDAVTCGHFVQNKRSRRVIEKCGFVYFASSTYKTYYGEEFECKDYILTRERYEKLYL